MEFQSYYELPNHVQNALRNTVDKMYISFDSTVYVEKEIIQKRKTRKSSHFSFLTFYFQVRLCGPACIWDISDKSKCCTWSMRAKIVCTAHQGSYLQKLQLGWEKMKKDSLLRLITVLGKGKNIAEKIAHNLLYTSQRGWIIPAENNKNFS